MRISRSATARSVSTRQKPGPAYSWSEPLNRRSGFSRWQEATNPDWCGRETMRFLCVLTFSGVLLGQVLDGHPAKASPEVESNLRAGAAKVDITPPPDTPVIGHPRKTSGARDPIRAGVLLLDDGKTKAAIATFDLIGGR